MQSIVSLRFRIAWAAPCLVAALSAPCAENRDITFTGMGWVQYGLVGRSTDTVIYNYNGNSLQATGAQISLLARLSDRLIGKAGLGVLENLTMAAGFTKTRGRVPTNVSPYIAEASFTYSFWDRQASGLRMTGGLFPFNYNPNVQNLGLYLLRGPVYPGILVSGFETNHVLPIANMLGFNLHQESGGFTQDLVLSSETDLYPYFDLSPAYIAGYRFGRAFHLGAGVNFYHLIPIRRQLTTPPLDSAYLANNLNETAENQVHHPYDRVMIYVDTAGGKRDTTVLGFQGTKLMADASLDLKAWVGEGRLGPEDLKIYGEVAVIGLDRSKAYNAIYGDLTHRMPIMVGFNFPAFNFLNHLSLEVEWYGAPFRDDLTRYQPSNSNYESPLPISNSLAGREPQQIVDSAGQTRVVVVGHPEIPFSQADLQKNLTRDNWKWSLHGAKVIQGHFRISFQIANDHLRPGGIANQPTYEAILSTPKDWYWMTKVAYFF